MMALSITRTIVMIILWSTIQEVHTKGPHMNTLYVEIGQLYPRADFAGVLINLNMNKAIDRGKSALNITDHFLLYNKQDKLWADTLGPTETYISLPSNTTRLNITSIFLLQTSMKSQKIQDAWLQTTTSYASP